jgi:hypothetical protein
MSSQNNARKHVFGGMRLEFGRWRWALVECKNKQQPANFGTKTIAYFGEKPSQWGTFANLIFTEPHPAAPHTLNEKPNPEKKISSKSISSKFCETSSQWAIPCTNLILTETWSSCSSYPEWKPKSGKIISSKSIWTSHPNLTKLVVNGPHDALT